MRGQTVDHLTTSPSEAVMGGLSSGGTIVATRASYLCALAIKNNNNKKQQQQQQKKQAMDNPKFCRYKRNFYADKYFHLKFYHIGSQFTHATTHV